MRRLWILLFALIGSALFAADNLLEAIEEGDIAFIKSYQGDLNQVLTDKGFTALMVAVDKGKLEAVKALLAAKADVNVVTKNGVTALLLAAANGNAELVGLLLQAKANVDSADTVSYTHLTLPTIYSV